MLKNILNLDGAQELSKKEQKEINGGLRPNSGCSIGGVHSSLDSCLCGGGTYSVQLGKCLSGTPTGKIFENATSCCYSSFQLEF